MVDVDTDTDSDSDSDTDADVDSPLSWHRRLLHRYYGLVPWKEQYRVVYQRWYDPVGDISPDGRGGYERVTIRRADNTIVDRTDIPYDEYPR